MRKLLLAGLAGLMMAGPALADQRDNRHDGREYRESQRDFRNDRRDYRNDRPDYRNDRRDFRQDRRDLRFDRHDFRQSRQNEWRWAGPRHRAPAYYYPRGLRYRPFGVGLRLPPAYFGGGYWIDNPGYYRLPLAYPGTRWVRVGPDALLIGLGNGIVISAVRGLYW